MTTLLDQLHTLPPGSIIELMVEVPGGDLLTYDHARLASALGVHPTQLIVETDGGRYGMITVYQTNPLADVRAATRDDLIMNKGGQYVCGVYHNGLPATRRLFDPRTGSAQRFVFFGTTGAGKSRALQLHLAAEKANGIVSWVCDLKGGQSVPEALRCVDWPGTTLEHAILMLRAGVALIAERTQRYAALGRTAFIPNDPDPLVHITLDEANRVLRKQSPYREEAADHLAEISRTGRSVGVGSGMGAQGAHLEELGGSDTLRAMFKEGEITLLRWSSNIMQHLVSDGALPVGTRLMPIPKTLQQTHFRSQLDPDFLTTADEEDDPVTAGCAYLLSGKHPTGLMRHLRVGSITPLPGLDPEIMALYGPEEPRRLETASHAAVGEAYRVRHDTDATHALLEAIATEPARKRATTTLTSSGDDTEQETAVQTGPAAIEDRIIAVLTAAGPLGIDAIWGAVNDDRRGKDVKRGTVTTTLSQMANDPDGAVIRVEHGTYAIHPR